MNDDNKGMGLTLQALEEQRDALKKEMELKKHLACEDCKNYPFYDMYDPRNTKGAVIQCSYCGYLRCLKEGDL